MNSSKKNVSDFAFITKADFEKLNDDQKVAYVDEVCNFYNIPDWSYYAGYDPYEDPEVNIEGTGKKFFL